MVNMNLDTRNSNNENEEIITFKKIKSKKIKKELLINYIKEINNYIDDKTTQQKNLLIFKSLYSNLKYINEDNIILENNKIKCINGLFEKNYLLHISKILYKNNEIPK